MGASSSSEWPECVKFSSIMESPGSNVRLPFALQRSKLEPELLKHLLPSVDLSTDQLDAHPGYDRCVDYPNIPLHIYYEGYFHAHTKAGAKAFVSMKSRGGYDFAKPAAPIEWRAFCEAMRQVNHSWIQQISEEVKDLNSTLHKVISEGRLFADLSIQVHGGDGIPADGVFFHRDAANSLLHMAVSVNGRRALHYSSSDTATGSLRTNHFWEDPGEVYVTSPANFEHGVEYPSVSKWADRVVAVQCRALFAAAELRQLHRDLYEPKQQPQKIYTAITKALATAEFRMPTLAEVLEVQKQMEPDEDLKLQAPDADAKAAAQPSMPSKPTSVEPVQAKMAFADAVADDLNEFVDQEDDRDDVDPEK